MSSPQLQPEAPPRPKLPPQLALVVAVLSVSTGALFIRFAGEEHDGGAPSLVIAFYRCAFATVALALVGWRQCLEEWPRLERRERGIAAATGVGLALHFATWITSLSYTTVASSIVIVNTTPLWVALLTPALSSDRRLRGATVAAIALSIVGCAVLGWNDLQVAGSALFGDALALVGAWMCALYMLAGRKLRRSLSLFPYVIACYGIAAVVLLIVALARGHSLLGYAPEIYGWLVALALVPQVIGHSAYNYVLRYLSAAATSIATLGENVGGIVLAWWFLGEALEPRTAVGAGIVVAGMVIAVRSERVGVASPAGATKGTGASGFRVGARGRQ
jgi:drug/metabolite transporter (DMT)-like permease